MERLGRAVRRSRIDQSRHELARAHGAGAARNAALIRAPADLSGSIERNDWQPADCFAELARSVESSPFATAASSLWPAWMRTRSSCCSTMPPATVDIRCRCLATSHRFGALSVHVRPASPLTGDAVVDATALLKAIRGGRLYTAVDAWASPPAFEFTATNRSAPFTKERGFLRAVRSRCASGATRRLSFRRRSGGAVKRLREKTDHEFTVDAADDPAVYRVTIRDPRRPGAPPWVISNPIYVRAAGPISRQASDAPPAATQPAAVRWPQHRRLDAGDSIRRR